jgi:hypothetical protein
MKRTMNLIVAMMLFFATACSPEDKPLTPSTTTVGDITLTIGDRTFTATMEQNSTAEAFRALLPLTLEMQELNGNEKYHYLSQSLPTNHTKVGTIHAGDIMLYGDNCVVVFYETFTTSYQYTPIGHITSPEGLKEALGSRTSKVIFTSQ